MFPKISNVSFWEFATFGHSSFPLINVYHAMREFLPGNFEATAAFVRASMMKYVRTEMQIWDPLPLYAKNGHCKVVCIFFKILRPPPPQCVHT